MKLKLLLILVLLNFSSVFSQEDKTVILTVSAQGQTISEAKQNALRDAIEQAFGAFISSSTEILNDELVKDEILSVSNGNIQDYEVISEVKLPNGDYATTLKATVSITRLTSFAESKGANIEFKGGLFAVNMMQQDLNEKAELKAVKNIIKASKSILKKSFDYSIESKGSPFQVFFASNPDKPKPGYKIPLTVKVKLNNNFDAFRKYFNTSMRQLSMSSEEIKSYKDTGKSFDLLLSYNADNKNNPPQPVYFRNSKSIDLIQALIFSVRNDVLNFNIDCGLNSITGHEITRQGHELSLIDFFRIYVKAATDWASTPSIINDKVKYFIGARIRNNSISESFSSRRRGIGNQIGNRSNPYYLFLNPRFTLKKKYLNFEDGKRNIILNFYNFYSYNFKKDLSIQERGAIRWMNPKGPFLQLVKDFFAKPEEFLNEETIIWINFYDTKTIDEIKQISEYTIKPILD